MRGNKLLVAENNESRELLREIAHMVDMRDPRISNKISKVIKETKNRNRYPVLILANGQQIDDVNKIYFFIMNDQEVMRSRSRSNPYDKMHDYEEFIHSNVDYDDDGRPIVNGNEYEDDIDDDREEKIDVNRATAEFEERRSRIQVPKLRRGKVVRKPIQEEEYEEKPRRSGKSQPKSKQKKEPVYDDYSDNSFDERYPDGDRDLDDYMQSEARDARR